MKPSIVLLLVLIISATATVGQAEQVVSVDSSGHVYIGNGPVSDLSTLTKGTGPLFLRVDQDSRAEAMCGVLTVADKRTIFLGQPKTLGKSIPVNLGKRLEDSGAFRVTAQAVGRKSWSLEPGSYNIIVEIDFDGTLSWGFNSILNLSTLDERFDELAVQHPHAHVYIHPNKLAKAAWTEAVAISAKRSGFSEITFACPDS